MKLESLQHIRQINLHPAHDTLLVILRCRPKPFRLLALGDINE